jgi:hypothetical protein
VKGKPRTNLAASVRQRLLNLAQARGEDFQRLLTRYAIERFLYRLSQSPHASCFILKGALLFLLWMEEPPRRTKDLDLLGTGDPSPACLTEICRELCALAVENDGLTFAPETVTARFIREDNVYGGVRIRLVAFLEKARIPIRIDVGFGDAITPAPQEVPFPTLLDFPAPQLRVYPRETVIAEKPNAVVVLDWDNTRMKDFYDLWTLGQRFAYDGERLREAVAATFARRAVPLPDHLPVGLSREFSEHPQKQAQWKAFVQQSGALTNQPRSLAEVVAFLGAFLLPVLEAARESQKWAEAWPPGGSWHLLPSPP